MVSDPLFGYICKYDGNLIIHQKINDDEQYDFTGRIAEISRQLIDTEAESRNFEVHYVKKGGVFRGIIVITLYHSKKDNKFFIKTPKADWELWCKWDTFLEVCRGPEENRIPEKTVLSRSFPSRVLPW